MNGLHPLLLLSLSLLFLSCTGVFVNPDLAGGKPLPPPQSSRVPLPLIHPNEELLYRSLKDSGFARIPEHDFYRMQETYLNLAAQQARPDLPFLYFTDTVANKDITRVYNYDSPAISPLRYMETLAGEGLSVFELKTCTVDLLCLYLRSGIPIIAYGTVIIKKQYRSATPELSPDTAAPVSAETNGDDSRQVFRKLITFDLISGYSKLSGPSQTLPGETSAEFLFETRSRLNFKARTQNPVLNMALSLFGGTPPGSNWVFANLYVMVPKGVTAEAIVEKLKLMAVQLRLTGELPLPDKLF